VHGTDTVGAVFGLHVIAYNLIQLGNLLRRLWLSGDIENWTRGDTKTGPPVRL
jgi:hypothetical protein